MRILVDARIGWGSGIGRVVSNTIGRVAALRPQDQFDVLINEPDRDAAERAVTGQGNCKVRICTIRPFSMAEQWQLRRYAVGYDLTWFTNYWVPLAWTGRFVVIVYDLLHLESSLFPASRTKRTLSRLTFHKIRRAARAVMFISRFSRRCFEREIGKPRLATTLLLGADHAVDRRPAAPSERQRRILVVAAAKQHKNLPLILDAWRGARLSRQWRLTLISPDASHLRSAIDLERFVAETDGAELRRSISDPELAALYDESAILLMPSLYEGFGLPLVEAMQAGMLCVTSTAGALVEVAQGCLVFAVDGYDREGWSRAIEDACALVERDDIDLAPWLALNRAQVARYQWSTTAEQIAAALEGVATSY